MPQLKHQDIEPGTLITLPPHGTGEIMETGDETVLYFAGADMTIRIHTALLIAKPGAALVNDIYDIPAMLHTLLTLDQPSWNMEKQSIGILDAKAQTGNPTDLARQLVALWLGKTSDVQTETMKQKIVDDIVQQLGEHLQIHMNGRGEEITIQQATKKIRTYRLLRNHKLVSERAVITR